MATPGAADDLNTVISAAVLARIEAEVAASLAGSDVINSLVIAQLREQIEVTDRSGYGRRKTTFLRETVDAAIRTATKAAVVRVVTDHTDEIEALVTQHFTEQLPAIAKQLVGKVADAVESPHGVRVELNYPGRS